MNPDNICPKNIKENITNNEDVDKEYEVKKIVGSFLDINHKNKEINFFFKISWVNYDEISEIPIEDCLNCPIKSIEFNEICKKKFSSFNEKCIKKYKEYEY